MLKWPEEPLELVLGLALMLELIARDLAPTLVLALALQHLLARAGTGSRRVRDTGVGATAGGGPAADARAGLGTGPAFGACSNPTAGPSSGAGR